MTKFFLGVAKAARQEGRAPCTEAFRCTQSDVLALIAR